MTQKSMLTHRIAVGEKLIQAVRSWEGRQLRKTQETWELQNPELRDAWYIRIGGEEQGPIEYADVNHALLEGYGPVEVLHADRADDVDEGAEEAGQTWTTIAYEPLWKKPRLGLILTAVLAVFVAILLAIAGEALLPWPWETYFGQLAGLAALVWWLLPFASAFVGKKETAEPKEKAISIKPVEKEDKLAA